MRELSTEEKAQRYDKAIKRAKSKIKNDNNHVLYESDIIEMFPELKESEEGEDEKIMKAIHIYLDWLDGRKDYAPKGEYTIRDMIAWLEKQGTPAKLSEEEQKPSIVDILKKYFATTSKEQQDKDWEELKYLNNFGCELVEQKPSDNKPQFHEGDWIVHHGTENIYQVVAIIGNQYQLKYGDNYTVQSCADVDRCARLWDITKDAKVGDILVDGNLPFIFKKIDANKYSYAYCGISVDDGFKIESDGESGEWTWMQDIKPATQEQHDTLIKAMTDAGYTFDFEKKELKKIEQKIQPKFEVGDVMRSLKEAKEGITDGLPVVVSIDEEYYHCNNELISIKDQDKYGYPPMNRKQKPAEWTAEDENQRINTIGLVKNANDCAGILDKETALNWLNDIKDRFVPQSKQEWSEEDESHIRYLIECLEHCKKGVSLTMTTPTAQEYIDWLKSLKDRYTWKPSDEQLNTLYDVLNPCDGFDRRNLESLYQDLKKL